MSAFKDYYLILSVGRQCTQEEIRAAYRKLAFDLHPDRNPTEEAHQRFLEIGQAYRILSDPTQRTAYNLRYDKHHGLRKSTGNPSQSYEMVRRKRMSRYNRSGYAQRMRYRGSASGSGHQPYNPSTGQTREWQSRSQRSYSEAYVEQILEEESKAQIGFRYYARLLRAIAGGVLLFCLGMVVDKAMATRTAEEEVLSLSSMPWSFTAPNVTLLKTSRSTFAIKNHHANRIKEGTKVTLIKSPFAKIPVKVYVFDRGWKGPLPVYESRYTGVFGSVWILIVLCAATVFIRRNPEFSAYLGTFTMIVTLVILGLILS